MWFRTTRALALGAMLGLAACAPGTSGSLVVGAAPTWHGGTGWGAPAWGAPGWHGAARPWRHDPFWHGRPVGQWGGHWGGHRPHHGWHRPGWHHRGWHGRGWQGGPRHSRW